MFAYICSNYSEKESIVNKNHGVIFVLITIALICNECFWLGHNAETSRQSAFRVRAAHTNKFDICLELLHPNVNDCFCPEDIIYTYLKLFRRISTW